MDTVGKRILPQVIQQIQLSAYRARKLRAKRSQILAVAAGFNRREFHRRTAGRALWALVLFVEHGIASVRRSEFSGKPSDRLRCEGVRCNDADLDVIAFGAFEQSLFETNWPR